MSPYWQDYWYELLFRDEREPEFGPLGPGPPRQVANTWLRTNTIEEFADWVLAEGAGELDDLRGDLRVRIYTTPAATAEPALERTIELTGPAR